MKAKKTEKAPASKSKKASVNANRLRKMEPLNAKELKNQRFDSEDDDDTEPDPEMMDENFKGFEDLDNFEDDEEDDY